MSRKDGREGRTGSVLARLLADDRGFLLLGLVTVITVGSILASAAVQEWSVILRREREAQLIFVQEQYAAAIMRYQEANGSLPVDLDALNEVHATTGLYLRHPYVDPMTPGATLEDWCLLKLGGAGRVVSSCSASGDQSQLGLGSSFKLGEQSRAPRNRPGAGGLAAGQGIVGVHSKSKERAYNILKRDEETYDRWYYTLEDYRKEVAGRAIPGLPQGKGPGLGTGQQPGIQGPGQGRGNQGGFGRSSGRPGRRKRR
ncbi:MAG TPA: type II secretion system protein [Acidobacteria bacterium]|nr:type II secretion system protein [Acidobacteriota bacterium]